MTEEREVYADQAEMLERVNQVQQRLGHPQLECLTAFYRGEASFNFTLPELDPYRAVRQGAASGPLERLPELSPVPAEPRFYAYLAEAHPAVEATVRGLIASGLPGELYIRETNIAFDAEELARYGIDLLETMPVLDEAVARGSVVVSHASINTVQSSIGAGRPQVMIPLKLDQVYTAEAVEESGLGLNLTANATPEAVGAAVRQAAADVSMRQTVADYCATVRARGQHDRLPQIVARCVELLK